MIVRETFVIRQGDHYMMHAVRLFARDGTQVVEDVELGEVRVLDFAVEFHTHRELVLFRNGGNRIMACSLADFASRFRPVKPQGPQDPGTQNNPGGR